MKKMCMICLAIAFAYSCGRKSMDIKKFYFPYANFINQKVYVYESEDSDSMNTTYWNFKTFVQEGDTFFTTTVFDKNIRPTSIYVNYIKPDGAYLQKMIYVIQDTIQLTYLVEQNEVFKWEINHDQKLHMFMTLTMDAGKQEIYSERTFEKKPIEKQCMGKQFQTIEVTDQMNISLSKDNRTSTEEVYKKGFFADGLGLIEFSTSLPNGKEEHFKLIKILNEQEWMNLIENNRTDTISNFDQ